MISLFEVPMLNAVRKNNSFCIGLVFLHNYLMIANVIYIGH